MSNLAVILSTLFLVVFLICDFTPIGEAVADWLHSLADRNRDSSRNGPKGP